MAEKAERKKINIFSFGHKDEGAYPSHPKNTLQVIIDLRALIDDPKEILKGKDGLTQEVLDFILKQRHMPAWLALEAAANLSRAFALDTSEYVEMNICYGCGGGIQRSVAVAGYLYRRFVAEYGDDYEVTITHRSLEKKKNSS